MNSASLVRAANLFSGQALQAAPFSVLSDFPSTVVTGSEAGHKPDRLTARMSGNGGAKGDCLPALAWMDDAGAHTHGAGAPLTPQQEAFVGEARNAVRIMGIGKTIETVEFSVDMVGILRRRLTR